MNITPLHPKTVITGEADPRAILTLIGVVGLRVAAEDTCTLGDDGTVTWLLNRGLRVRLSYPAVDEVRWTLDRDDSPQPSEDPDV